jgi:hypothetical protein
MSRLVHSRQPLFELSGACGQLAYAELRGVPSDSVLPGISMRHTYLTEPAAQGGQLRPRLTEGGSKCPSALPTPSRSAPVAHDRNDGRRDGRLRRSSVAGAPGPAPEMDDQRRCTAVCLAILHG